MLPTREAAVCNFMSEPECLFDICLKSLDIKVAPSCPLIFIFPSPLLPFDLLSFAVSHTCLSLLPWFVPSSFLSWSSWPENMALSPLASQIPLSLFHFCVFLQPSGPDYMLGPSKDDRTLPSSGWVRRWQLKNSLRCAHLGQIPSRLQQHGAAAPLLCMPCHKAH